MTHRDVVAVGASAGGVEALRAMASGLPADLPAAVLVVLHMPRTSSSALPRILARSGPLPAAMAVDGEPLQPGRIYVAPADHHLLLLHDRLRLSRGPAENGHRPAVDPLFRSAARAAGPRAIAVVLSGSGDDGAAGAATVAARGGVVAVQSPDDALYAAMPLAAMARVEPDHVVAAADVGPLLSALTTVPVDPVGGQPPDTQLDGEIAISNFADLGTESLPSTPAGFGCPSCGGALFELKGQAAPRYRCRVGHAWSPESLLDEHAVATEGALWTALRALEEKSALSRRLADIWGGRPYGSRFEEAAKETEGAGALIRGLIDRLAGSTATQQE